MLFKLGLVLIFFLPVIESFNRQLGFDFLLLGSLLVSAKFFWERKIILDKINSLWIIMLIVFTISLFKSLSFNRSYFEYLRYIAYFLIFISVRNSTNSTKIFKYFFVPMVVINSLILAILAVVYFVPDLNLKPLHTMTLFYPQFGHNHLADILVFAIPISISQFMVFSHKVKKIFWFIISAGFTFFLIYSAGRAAALSLTLALFIYIFFVDKNKGWYGWGLIFGIISIFLLSLIFYISNFYGPVHSDFAIVRKLYRPFAADFHLANDYQAIIAWRNNPIFGTGLNTFRILAKKIPPVNIDWYTHNQYLELLAETGIMGFLVFMSIILVILKQSFRKSVNLSISIPLFAGIIQSLFDYQWHFISIYLLFWIGCALVMPKQDNTFRKNIILWQIFLVIVSILFLLAFEPPFHNLKNMY